jgi:hypothetical protein
MKVSEAKKKIEELQEYIDLYSRYFPTNMKEHAIKLYAELEHVGKVAEQLNHLGYRVPGRKEGTKVKLTSNDVTGMIDTKPQPSDKLHLIVRKSLNTNRSKIRG